MVQKYTTSTRNDENYTTNKRVGISKQIFIADGEVRCLLFYKGVIFLNIKTKKIVYAALMTALTCVATMVIKVPSPLKGYLNLGDGIVLAAGFMLSPTYGFLAAGLGSALADIFSGYIVYAPATFVIKGIMALIAFYGFKLLSKKCINTLSRIISGIWAEIFMVAGYFLFEGFLYGFIPSLVNIPANGVQGVAGIIISTLLVKVLEKAKITLE